MTQATDLAIRVSEAKTKDFGMRRYTNECTSNHPALSIKLDPVNLRAFHLDA